MNEKRKQSHLSGLKILVSVVRFRPGPPNSNNALLMRGIFFCELGMVNCLYSSISPSRTVLLKDASMQALIAIS